MALSHWSELDLIERFAATCRVERPDVVLGIGDDCAVVQPDGRQRWLLTADMLVDTVHFDTSWHPPYQLGRKCLAVNLSDIAAMGGTPAFVLLSVAIPDNYSEQWLNQWISGLASLMREFDCALIGGDTVRGHQFTVNVTVIGTADPDHVILRGTAQPGESIYVSGPLGSAAAGLILCRQRDHLPPLAEPLTAPFIQRHLDPYPDLATGQLLTRSGLVTAMQDLSDGLATDLAHIARKSGIGARIEAKLLPAQPQLEQLCSIIGADPVELQVAGGDDYHLLFTVRHGADRELLDFLKRSGGMPMYRIGTTTAGSGILLRDANGHEKDITFGGFEHRSDR